VCRWRDGIAITGILENQRVKQSWRSTPSTNQFSMNLPINLTFRNVRDSFIKPWHKRIPNIEQNGNWNPKNQMQFHPQKVHNAKTTEAVVKICNCDPLSSVTSFLLVLSLHRIRLDCLLFGNGQRRKEKTKGKIEVKWSCHIQSLFSWNLGRLKRDLPFEIVWNFWRFGEV
jgi:hypothetical protein